MKETIMKLQLALFYQQPEFRPDADMHELNKDMGNLFDAMPQIHSLPTDVPHDFPRVLMKSENNKYNCNIGLSRIDFIVNCNNLDTKSWHKIFNDFEAKAALFVNSTTSRSKIIRFGVIGNFYFPDENPSRTISKKHLKTDLQKAQEINLRYNKSTTIHGLNLNNISSINTVFLGDKNNLEKGILIEQDVNNIPTSEEVCSDKLNKAVTKILSSFSLDQIENLVK